MLVFNLLTMATSILPFLNILNESNSGCNSTHPDGESKFFAALLSCPSLAHNVATHSPQATRKPMLMPGAIWKNSPSKPMIFKTKRHKGCRIFFNHLPRSNIEKNIPPTSRSHDIFFPGNPQQSASRVSHQQLLQYAGPKQFGFHQGKLPTVVVVARLAVQNYGPPAVSSNTDLTNR